ncbi:hypothetical protein CXK97_19485 [Stutzerimonas stutzeri]|nr:hypothetical protein CXK97_19485 [Stutzerimonas stutzeri]
MRLTTIPRIKAVSLAKMRIRRRRLSALKQSFALDGGPITRAWLCTPGTLCFRVGGWRGYYDGENKWVDL